MDDKVAAALQRIPRLAGVPAQDISCERLGGLTNLIYRIDRGSEPFVLRIPGAGTEDYIDRKVEAHNARVAAEAGVVPRSFSSTIRTA